MTDRLWRVDGVNIVVSSGDSSDEEDEGNLVIMFSGSPNNGAGLTSQIPWTLVYQIFTGPVEHRLEDYVLPYPRQ